MVRAAIFGRNAKVTKISGACGVRSCDGSVGPPESHAPRVLAQHLIILLSYFSMMKSMQKSSRNEASALSARIGRSLGMLLTTASLGS